MDRWDAPGHSKSRLKAGKQAVPGWHWYKGERFDSVAVLFVDDLVQVGAGEFRIYEEGTMNRTKWYMRVEAVVIHGTREVFERAMATHSPPEG